MRRRLRRVGAGPGVAATVLDLVRRVPMRRTAALDGLTPREAEIFGPLARGRSNSEIRAERVLSENTVKPHVRAVLQKLDLRDRVHAVIHAYENGLVARHEFHPNGRYQVHPFG
ncbi:LuxR C-terminal-related transcriptional regulator [Streptosporangium sp. NPDC006007]|uniref:response regulator transcription factor n=1 Tax=Streptosporangium sp. NPDC006007 TaxID=3154575 RepID=UPI0033A6F5FB